MTHWRVTAAGCVATSPVTVPKQLSHEGVAMLCPPEEDSLNLGRKAQVEEGEVERFVSGASMSCMTRQGMSTLWTMQVSCTSPSDMNLR